MARTAFVRDWSYGPYEALFIPARRKRGVHDVDKNTLRALDSQLSGRQPGITQSDHALVAAFPSMPQRRLRNDW